jgi:HK97 family phage major capsid protein
VSEGSKKPATEGTMALKTMAPKKLAAIMVNSAEVVRANPGNYINLMREQLAEAFAKAFDLAALHDEGPDGTMSGGPFSTFVDQTTKIQEIGETTQTNGGIHVDLVEAMRTVVTDSDSSSRRYRVSGWALDSILEPDLWGAVDSTGRPIYVNLPADEASSATEGAGRLMNRPSFMGEGVASNDGYSVLGYGGDWSRAVWGVVGGISYDVSTDATVTIDSSLVSLWENNLVAIRAEAEYGFLVDDPQAFCKLTNLSVS